MRGHINALSKADVDLFPIANFYMEGGAGFNHIRGKLSDLRWGVITATLKHPKSTLALANMFEDDPDVSVRSEVRLIKISLLRRTKA